MKGPMFRVVGFDCAEEEHVAVLLDDDGEFEQRVKVVNRRDRIQECLAKLMLALGEDATLVIVVESKRAHGQLVAEEADRLGCQVMQVNTVALNHFRDVKRQGSNSEKGSRCGKRTLSSPWTPSSPGLGSAALWKAGHRHPPSAFPQGLENPCGVSHSSPAPTTTTREITSRPP